MKPHRQDDAFIAERAAEWFFALSANDAETQSAFGEWLRESPRHVEEFLLVSAAYKELDASSLPDTVDIESLRKSLADIVIAHPGAGAMSPARTASAPRMRRRYSGARRWAIAAAVVPVAIALVWTSQPSFLGKDRYSTTIGEVRSFELKDGSVVQLNTQSRIDVRFSNSKREIQLLAGEAVFKVSRDPVRPFRVHTGNAVIQALGTEFNVYRRQNDTMVSVLEGSVRVTDGERAATDKGATRAEKTLAAGEEARITAMGKIMEIGGADPAKTTAWRQRRLIFRGESLTEVAEEFNRYNRSPQIRVEGVQARAKPLAGIFDADDPESLLLFLTRLEDLAIDRRQDTVVVRAR